MFGPHLIPSPMRLRSTLLLTLAALWSVAASAQPFTVVSSVPADHAVSVPLQTTLALTFSSPVRDYAAAGGAPALILFPAAAATVGDPVRSADGRTLSFPLTLLADTRYVALLLGADAEAGGGLTTPFALNLTTAASNGPLTVRGSVTGTGGLTPGGSIVALVTGDVATGDVQIVAADVVEGGAASLAYALGPVPLGLYTAGAVRLPFPLGASTQGVGYGLYDPDGDGTPNPIFSPTGVNITVAPPPPQTAGNDFGTVQAAANTALGGARLVEVDPSAVDLAGQSPVWSYRFQTFASADEVRIVRLGLFTLPVPASGDGRLLPDVALGPVDSDDALTVAEASGGEEFRRAHPGQTIVVTAAALPGFVDTVIVWEFVYAASGGDVFRILLPYGADAAEGDPDVAPQRLALQSANPARGAVEASLTLDAPAEAHVAVVDARGRTVARLTDGPLPAGATPLRWTPGADTPAGTYWIVARTGARTEALAVTRVR